MATNSQSYHHATFGIINEQFICGKSGNVKLIVDVTNYYINVTRLCKQFGKGCRNTFNRWLKQDANHALIDGSIMNYTKYKSQFRGYYVYCSLIHHITDWLDPRYIDAINAITGALMEASLTGLPLELSQSDTVKPSDSAYMAYKYAISGLDQQVYIIYEEESDFCRIGCTRGSNVRLNIIQQSSPRTLQLFDIVVCNKTTDAKVRIHSDLTNYHIRGDWFNIPREVMAAYLATIRGPIV